MSSGVHLRCNSCWGDLDGKSVVTACQHLFCLKCAQNIVETNSGCSICQAVISKSTVKLVTSVQDAAALKMLLCGYVPEAAFASALASVEFYISQQQMLADENESRLNNKINKVQEACRKRLAEVHNNYKEAKRKCEEAQAARDQALQDAQELQEKYAQKSLQTRKLQDMFKNSQQQIQALQREKSALQQENMALQQELKASRQSGGGFGSGRSISPLAPGDMVTTVKRTTANFVTASPPNIGDLGKAMQQSHIPSSGRVQGISGGYRTQQGAAGGSGAGRMLGGSLDPNSPGAVLPLSSQGLGRTGSDGSFGRHVMAAPRHEGGSTASGQDPHNLALRRMLGMENRQEAGRLLGPPVGHRYSA